MKKFFKFVGSAALLCATVAGGIFAYKKFFAADPFADDLGDDSEDLTAEEVGASERGYVSLSSGEEAENEADTNTEEADTEEDTEETDET
ncbi:MAG: hypothetical protein HFI29_13500 [Lachnospiraceae bacterium]|jgi:hypothetical protein|nr:hypothetical protein [Lachnospiraceae bacterium]